jgi:hypothetical protein
MAIKLTKQNASSVSTPQSGKVQFFIDSTSGSCKLKDEAGTVTDVGGGGGGGSTIIKPSLYTLLSPYCVEIFDLSVYQSWGVVSESISITGLLNGTAANPNGMFNADFQADFRYFNNQASAYTSQSINDPAGLGGTLSIPVTPGNYPGIFVVMRFNDYIEGAEPDAGIRGPYLTGGERTVYVSARDSARSEVYGTTTGDEIISDYNPKSYTQVIYMGAYVDEPDTLDALFVSKGDNPIGSTPATPATDNLDTFVFTGIDNGYHPATVAFLAFTNAAIPYNELQQIFAIATERYGVHPNSG